MCKTRFKLGMMVLALAGFAQSAGASPLTMTYTVDSASGGGYDYNFKITLDNHDGSWAAGQGWSWIVFGDANSTESPLFDFKLTSAIPAPFAETDYSHGWHTGPLWLEGADGWPAYWTPAAVGESLVWSGNASTLVPEGSMLWSTVNWKGKGTTIANFEVASVAVPTQDQHLPEPASITILGVGLAGMALSRRRKQMR